MSQLNFLERARQAAYLNAETAIKTQKLLLPNPSEKMAFNPPSDDEKRAVVNPKNLRFTQLDIAPSFTNPEHPNVQEAISRIIVRRLDPAEFGELTVHTDKQGVVWCENNRRLYVLRMAGVQSVRVKFNNNDYKSRRIKEADKNKLNDPAFLPKIRGETAGVQIPQPSISGPSVDQEEKGSSLLGVMGAVSATVVGLWALYNT